MQVSDRFILAACLTFSIVGIAGLLLAASEMKAEKVRPSEVDASLTGRLVEVTGRVQSFKSYGANYAFRLCSDSCVQVFARTAKNNALPKTGEMVVVRGVVRQSKGRIEVVPLHPGDVEVQ